MSRLGPFLASCCLTSALACSSPSSPPAGGTAGTAGASGSAPTSGGSGGSAGTAGSGGTSAGQGGQAGGTTAGNGGSDGGGGGTGGAASAGITCTPGTDGNGTHDQPGPYGAPPEATPQATAPAGTLTPLTPFQSTIYDHTFGYRIYVPAQYQAGKRAAFMMLQDGPSHYLGQDSEAKFFTNIVLDNLIAEGTIPVTIALFVDPCMQKCEDERRGIFDNTSDQYPRFVTEELLPAVIEGKYALVEDPQAWLNVGFSAGASQGFHAIWNRPIFQKFIGHNSSFAALRALGLDYAQVVAQEPSKGFRVVLTSGTADLSDDRGNWLEVNTEMAQVLTDKGYIVRFMTGTGGHFPPDQSAMDFPNALRWMWQGCALSDY